MAIYNFCQYPDLSLHGWNLFNEMNVSRNLSLEFLTRSNTNQAAQPQKMVKGLKFRMHEVEGLYFLCSENKGADQRYCVTAQLICVFVFAYAKIRFSQKEAHLVHHDQEISVFL